MPIFFQLLSSYSQAYALSIFWQNCFIRQFGWSYEATANLKFSSLENPCDLVSQYQSLYTAVLDMIVFNDRYCISDNESDLIHHPCQECFHKLDRGHITPHLAEVVIEWCPHCYEWSLRECLLIDYIRSWIENLLCVWHPRDHRVLAITEAWPNDDLSIKITFVSFASNWTNLCAIRSCPCSSLIASCIRWEKQEELFYKKLSTHHNWSLMFRVLLFIFVSD